MEREFWRSRWSEGRIGFHEGQPNTYLARHLGVLGAGRRVLVPLCGKAEDLAFLAGRGHQVVGVEWVEEAVRAFYEEHQLRPEISSQGPFIRYHADSITLFAGDFFACTSESLGPIDALFDRAALIALPPQRRAAYAKHLRVLMPAGTPGLLVTLDYPQHQMSGPPFSVPESELRALFAGLSLERLSAKQGVLLGGGAAEGEEQCFLVRF